jgi:probable F420-dependent oxidoreductase
MDFGIVLQNDPPATRVVDLARQAEDQGFDYVWTFDSHLLWQEPFVIYPAILAATERVIVGPMVTNPATRDSTVLASMFATLNDTYGNRTICGIGRGDSAVRTLHGRPASLATLRESVTVIKDLGNSREADVGGSPVRFAWSHGSELDVWVAAYGPRALALTGEVGDGYILQLADPDIAAWMIGAVREAADAAGRDPDAIKFCVAAPAYVGEDRPHMRDQVRWFGGMVGNHVAEIVARYGSSASSGSSGGARIPAALTDYIEGRKGYDYAEHGRAGNSHTEFVPDDVVDRFCLVGTPDEHIARLKELEALGCDQFAVYLQHDSQEETLRAYGETIIPALQGRAGTAG